MIKHYESREFSLLSFIENMIRIAIVEDEEQALCKLEENLNKFFDSHDLEINVSRYNSAETFLLNFNKQYDLIFMDINLPGQNGMDAVFQLRKQDKNVLVIFVTSLAQYAIKGYEVNAFDFVVKPVSYYNLALKLERVLDCLNKSFSNEIVIKNKFSIRRLKASDIKYIEVRNHSLIYHTVDGDFTSSGSLKKVQDQLKGLPFSLCNQCYLVNLKFVLEIKGYMVNVDGTYLQISHPKNKEFIHALNHYLTNNRGN